MLKRVIAGMLTIVMLIGAVPVTAFAEQPEEPAVVDTGDVTVSGTNGFGTLLSEAITEEQENEAEENEEYEEGYSVTDLTIEGSVAVVEYATLEEATLVVALYSEDGMQLLTTATATVTSDAKEATAVFAGDMPEYFQASAYLLDTYDLSPLCASYDTPIYTREMQELLASTVADYDEELVLNLDEDETTNFAVYSENTTLIDYAQGVNTVVSVDDENAVYIIENADEQITGLSEGDIFAYEYGEEELLIVKVASVAIDGTTVTITGGELEMDEVFSHLKLEGESDMEDVTVDESELDSGVTYEGLVTETPTGPQARDWDGNASLGMSMAFKFNALDAELLKIDGGLNLDVRGELEYYISKNYKRLEFKLITGMALEIDLKTSLNAVEPTKVKLGKIYLPVLMGVASVEFTPSFVVKATASAKITLAHFETMAGFYVSWDKSGPDVDALYTYDVGAFEYDGKATVFIGLEMTPAANVLNGFVASAELTAQLGAEISLRADPEVLEKDAENRHECLTCIDGDLSLVFNTEASIKLLKQKKFSVEQKLLDLKWKMGDFYFCLDHGFGLGECPEHLYRVPVTVQDLDSAPLEGVAVTATFKDTGEVAEEGTTDGSGVVVFYLPEDAYLIEAEYEGEPLTKKIGVNKPMKVALKLSAERLSAEYHILGTAPKGSVTDYGKVTASGACGADAKWTLYGNGLMVIHGSGALNDSSEAQAVPWGTYISEITALKIEGGITYIGTYLFRNLKNVTSLTISEGVQTIGNNAFMGCEKLTTVIIPGSVTSVASSAFQYCSNLMEIHVDENNPNYSSDEQGVMYSKDKTILLIVPAGISGEYTIRDGVTTIGDASFCHCAKLTGVNIPDSVTHIGEKAFFRCTGISNMVIPDSVTDIGASAFNSCSGLTNITLPEDGVSFGQGAFASCTRLKTIHLPNDLTTIPTSLFISCSQLESIVLPESVSTINLQAFNGCISMTRIYIPANISFIGQRAFENCQSLSDVYYGGTEEQWAAIKIQSGNQKLHAATKHYNSTGPENDGVVVAAETLEELLPEAGAEEQAPTLDQVYGGEYGMEVSGGYTIKSAAFKGLVPGEQYVLLAMKSIEVEEPLKADNMLYVDQAVASADGTLNFRYVQRVATDLSYVVACGASSKNLNDGTITFPEMTADGERHVVEPVVTYGGETLTEGLDYVLVGRVDYTEAGTYTCNVRGIHNYTGLVECSYTVEGVDYDYSVTYTNASLSLDGDIGVNYYAEVSEDLVAAQGAYMRFTVAGQTQTIPLNRAEVESDGTYRFTCKVAAKQMTDTVVGQMYLADGTAVGEAKSYSVKAYCDAAIPVYSQYAAYAKLVDLMEAMLNYGAYSQIQLGYNTDNLANAGLADTSLPAITEADVAAYAHGATGSEEGISVSSVSLLLESNTTIRFYFQLDGTRPIDQYAFYVDGVKATPVQSDENMYYVDKMNVAAKDLDEMITVTVGGLTVKYGGLSYVRQVAVLYASYYNEKLVNVAKALYAYNQAANAYF